MSTFKFNFLPSAEDHDLTRETLSENLHDDGCPADDTDNLACELQLPSSKIEAKGLDTAEFYFKGHHLQILSGPSVEDHLLNSSALSSLALKNAIARHSDLEAGKYEGGLKLWECAVDLCQYLEECDISMPGCSVLELGCGGGLPGILAAKMGADIVHFQDFV
ncbi:hypothetical protein C0Q70_10022 [Pomacea canaliculata]|uniref:protein-histidine N-methyltransferase n=1 Tax=Pomacea canaliculata TaxID=400727 RepID=A0A2T7PBE9_POMCA|nr:hypothetical protein C0Q70_10022 [Pomacea canaliculata]